jgi:DNA-directed RNA polymerase specialized sigma24 family protein
MNAPFPPDAADLMTQDTVELLEPRIEALLARFKIPGDEAQMILDDTLMALLAKRERIKDPERWLLRTLKNRCLRYWQGRRSRLARIVDAGLLTVLSARGYERSEQEAIRGELAALVAALPPRLRRILEQRYGLQEGPRRSWPGTWEAEDPLPPEAVKALLAVARRASRPEPHPTTGAEGDEGDP